METQKPITPQVVIEMLQGHLEDVKSELTDTKARETKLLSTLETEQMKSRLLMLPLAENRKKRSFWGYFLLKR